MNKLLERNELLQLLSDQARGGDVEAARLYLEMISLQGAAKGKAGTVHTLRRKPPAS